MQSILEGTKLDSQILTGVGGFVQHGYGNHNFKLWVYLQSLAAPQI